VRGYLGHRDWGCLGRFWIRLTLLFIPLGTKKTVFDFLKDLTKRLSKSVVYHPKEIYFESNVMNLKITL
jgi:hypothetical protein